MVLGEYTPYGKDANRKTLVEKRHSNMLILEREFLDFSGADCAPPEPLALIDYCSWRTAARNFL